MRAASFDVTATLLKGLVVDREMGPDPFAALKEGSEEYHVYDRHYERIGRVDDVFIDERDAVSYIGVKMGFFGTNSTLVPVEIVRVNDLRSLVEVDEDAETIKHAPHFGHDEGPEENGGIPLSFIRAEIILRHTSVGIHERTVGPRPGMSSRRYIATPNG